MKLTNAIKKLSKHGEVKQNGNLFWAEIGGYAVEFMANGRIDEDTTITCIRARRKNDLDNSMTDYSAGVWCDNLTQAIKLATAA
ncbi:MAG: hypothetical protein RBS42_06615 [Campylobacterales bacterium]|jgi:hypothetical protein|nr:hypothetical protein [Campylobacterales bacterium]